MSLIKELKRRNVFRVGIAYVVVGWLTLQVGETLAPALHLPEWVDSLLAFFVILGFPLAIFFAWAFEMTPEGLKKESEIDRSQSITGQTGRKLDFFIIGVLVIAVGFLAVDKFGQKADQEPTIEVATTSGRPSIAVLPFANRSNREEDQFFTDGIHDDLLTTIANIGSMKVISRTSVVAYKDTTKKLPEIAAELGVDNILEGGIQRSGNQVRINVQLIDAATDEHLWAEIYDRELTAENLFAIQSEVSSAIAAALHTALSPDEARRINSVPTKNLEAYEAYMLGRERWRKRTAESVNESLELFQKAVDLDPDFALAWVGLSDAYRFQIVYAGASQDELLPKSEAAVQRALQLNDQLGEAYASLGAILRFRGDHEGSLVALRKALQLSPNYVSAYHWQSITLRVLGRYDEAEEIARQGLELDPLSVSLISNHALSLEHAGQFDDALARYERIIEIDPDSWIGYDALADYHEYVTGALDEALAWRLKAVDVAPSQSRLYAQIVWHFLDLADPASAANWLEKTVDLDFDTAESRFVRGSYALYVGDLETARDAMRYVLENSEFQSVQITALEVLSQIDAPETDIRTALAVFMDEFPEYADPGSIAVTSLYVYVAIPLAALLIEVGEQQQAEILLDKVLADTETVPVNGLLGYGYARAFVHALRGNRQQALAELGTVIDAGVRRFWWYEFDHSLGFKSLRDDPEFQALRAIIAADMAEQLAKANKKESQSFIN